MALTNLTAMYHVFAHSAGPVLSMIVEIEGGLPFDHDLHSYSFCDIRRLSLYPDRVRFAQLLAKAWDASSVPVGTPYVAHDLTGLTAGELIEWAALRAACWAP